MGNWIVMIEDNIGNSMERVLAAWGNYHNTQTNVRMTFLLSARYAYMEPFSQECKNAANYKQINEEYMFCAKQTSTKGASMLVSIACSNSLRIKITFCEFKIQKSKYINLYQLKQCRFFFKMSSSSFR